MWSLITRGHLRNRCRSLHPTPALVSSISSWVLSNFIHLILTNPSAFNRYHSKHTHEGTHTRRDTHAEETYTWKGHTHKGTYTQRNIHTKEHTHKGTYTQMDVHTKGYTNGGTPRGGCELFLIVRLTFLIPDDNQLQSAPTEGGLTFVIPDDNQL